MLYCVQSFSDMPEYESYTKIVDQSNKRGAIYLGDYKSAINLEFLKSHSINSVLTLTTQIKIEYKEEDNIFHKIIPAQDNSNFELTPFFEESFKFIDSALEKGSVLIHCVCGISRSSAILIGYLMKRYKKKFKEISRFVKKKRDIIYPNKGFVKQLNKFEEELFSK